MASDADILIQDEGVPTGADILIDDDGDGSPSITFEIPRVPKGTQLLALVVRNEVVNAPDGWTKVPELDGIGAAGLFLDGWARMVDDDDLRGEDEPLATVTFFSEAPQELQGRLYADDNTATSYMVERVAHALVNADATPGFPALLCQQAVNRVIAIASGAGAIAFTPPAGFAVDDQYTSSEFAERTIMFASKTAKATGTIAPGDGASAPAVTGRTWAIVLRNNPPIIPGELADVVPGHVGLIGPR